MAYEADFYTVANVVGYTGNLRTQNGSLYFHDPRKSKHGRITMGHDQPPNNGRGVPSTTSDYQRKNMFVDWEAYQNPENPIEDTVSEARSPWYEEGGFKDKVQVEYVDGEIVHVSRGQYIKISPKSLPQNRALIELILSRYPDRKANNRG